MKTAKELQDYVERCPGWALCLGMCVWGLALRLLAVGKVFPAQGDASHVVQHGKAFVAGVF